MTFHRTTPDGIKAGDFFTRYSRFGSFRAGAVAERTSNWVALTDAVTDPDTNAVTFRARNIGTGRVENVKWTTVYMLTGEVPVWRLP